MTESPKRKTRTSTAVKQRYNDKVSMYTSQRKKMCTRFVEPSFVHCRCKLIVHFYSARYFEEFPRSFLPTLMNNKSITIAMIPLTGKTTIDL